MPRILLFRKPAKTKGKHLVFEKNNDRTSWALLGGACFLVLRRQTKGQPPILISEKNRHLEDTHHLQVNLQQGTTKQPPMPMKASKPRPFWCVFPLGCGSKLNRRGHAGFGPCFHVPRFRFGYRTFRPQLLPSGPFAGCLPEAVPRSAADPLGLHFSEEFLRHPAFRAAPLASIWPGRGAALGGFGGERGSSRQKTKSIGTKSLFERSPQTKQNPGKSALSPHTTSLALTQILPKPVIQCPDSPLEG